MASVKLFCVLARGKEDESDCWSVITWYTNIEDAQARFDSLKAGAYKTSRIQVDEVEIPIPVLSALAYPSFGAGLLHSDSLLSVADMLEGIQGFWPLPPPRTVRTLVDKE